MGQRMCHLLVGATAAGRKTHSWEGVTASSSPTAAGVLEFLCSAASSIFSGSLSPCNSPGAATRRQGGAARAGAAVGPPQPCSGSDDDGRTVLAFVLSVREVPVLCLCLELAVPGSAGWKRAGGWPPARPCCKSLCLSLGLGCQLGCRAAALPCALPRRSRLRHGHHAPGAGQPLPDMPSLFAGCAQFQERHHQRPAAPAGPSLQGEGRGWGCPVSPLPRSGLGAVGWWLWLCGE